MFVSGLFVLASCQVGNRSRQPVAPRYQDAITREVSEWNKEGVFNGFAVAIVGDQGVLYQQGFGWADMANQKKYTRTIQHIASVSKILVGMALLKARELGKLDLDDPIENYLSFPVVNPYFPREKITIRQLATHSSSITDNEFYLSRNYYLKRGQDLKGVTLSFDEAQSFLSPDLVTMLEEFLKNVLSVEGKWNRNSFSRDKPGAIYEYSNMGTTLAAFMIEKATGLSFREFTREYLLQPLNMEDSGWGFQDVAFAACARLYENPQTPLPYYELVTYPDGGFISSVSDLSKLLTELIKGYNGKGTLLSKSSYREFYAPQLKASQFNDRNEQNPYSESYNVGIFIGFGYTGYIGHTGGDPGVLSMLFFDPGTSTGRIMMCNTSISDKKGNDCFYGIWDVLGKYASRLEATAVVAE
ncbi:serine hydrolase domain-containing protein [Niabella terrae]